MEPIPLFTALVLVSLTTVMFGGFSLLRLIGANQLSEFQQTYFRAGHAHAGVLLVFALAYLAILARTDLGTGVRWLACAALTVGILAQSGGMFLHMAVGRPGTWSAGNWLTTGGGVLLAASALLLAYAVLTAAGT